MILPRQTWNEKNDWQRLSSIRKLRRQRSHALCGWPRLIKGTVASRQRPADPYCNHKKNCYPNNSKELNAFLKTEVSPELARRALSKIFECLYGAEEDGHISFAVEKEWNTFVVCAVADELATISLCCRQPNRDEG